MTKNNFYDVIAKLSACRSESEKREKLLELGFEFIEEDAPDEDLLEEQVATPKNDRQYRLLAFFHGEQLPSLSILTDFLTEKASADVNYPLVRRYFRAANKQLKKLLLYGLEHNPIDRDLLNDLAFFNEFHLNLSELIAYYLSACKKITDLTVFEEIAKDFYAATMSYGYDAIGALHQDENIQADKQLIIQNNISLENK